MGNFCCSKDDDSTEIDTTTPITSQSIDHIRSRLAVLLKNVPSSWLGTTYPNDGRYVGRQRFLDEMLPLLNGNDEIKEENLAQFFPEDYVRLGSPLSTLLEMLRALEKGYSPSHVFCFASNALPVISVLLTATSTVYIYGAGEMKDDARVAMLKQVFKCDFKYTAGEPVEGEKGAIVLQISASVPDKKDLSPYVDAVASGDFLYIVNSKKVLLKDLKDAKGKMVRESIHTIRKRFGGAIPTPDALSLLKGEELPAKPNLDAFNTHLKELAGCATSQVAPLVTTTGLASLIACNLAALELGDHNVDILMASTAYGGSSQQTEILSKVSGQITKHTFGIQGKDDHVLEKITEALAAMKSGPRKPLTCVLIEYPTNPDMKDCDLTGLEAVLTDYKTSTGSRVVLCLDTTFSPISTPLKGLFTETPVMVWNSLSKSVSGGFTTGGSLVVNENKFAQQWLTRSHAYADLLDVHSKNCQLKILADNHMNTETRIENAHQNAVKAFRHLEAKVKTVSGQDMKVNFVTQAQLDKHVRPATFSFNLPPPAAIQSDNKAKAAFAQKFVDHLVTSYPKGIKPCVSFGQENTLVYVTVPATSTQGVISEEIKAKQAVGGIQLVRFSFPPRMDLSAFTAALDATLLKFYSPSAAN